MTFSEHYALAAISGDGILIWFEEMVLRVVQVFRIFYRTVTDWESDNRHALEYVLHLLEHYIRHENIRKENTENE